MIGFLSTLPSWLLAAIVGGLITYLVQVRLQKRKEKLKIILDLEIKPRNLSSLGAWAIVANLSSGPVWLEGLSFRAEEMGMRGDEVGLDVGQTVDAGDDPRIECHESIYEAFETITPRCDLHVGYVVIVAMVRTNRTSTKRRRTYKLTSGRYGVQDVTSADTAERLRERWKTKYFFWRLRG